MMKTANGLFPWRIDADRQNLRIVLGPHQSLVIFVYITRHECRPPDLPTHDGEMKQEQGEAAAASFAGERDPSRPPSAVRTREPRHYRDKPS